MTITTAFANASLDSLYGSAGFVALFTTMPTAAGGGVEPAVGGYARKAVTLGAAAAGRKANTGAVVFDEATVSLGSILGWGLYSASSGGTLRFFRTLVAPVTIRAGQHAEFAADALAITMT